MRSMQIFNCRSASGQRSNDSSTSRIDHDRGKRARLVGSVVPGMRRTALYQNIALPYETLIVSEHDVDFALQNNGEIQRLGLVQSRCLVRFVRRNLH